MQSYELLREVFKTKPPKQIAEHVGLSVSVVYKWAEPPEHAAGLRSEASAVAKAMADKSARQGGSGIANPLDRIEALLQGTGDQRIAQWICQRAGGFFIQNPKNIPEPHYLIPATNQIVQEFADLLNVIANAAHDNQVTGGEARQIRGRWEQLKTVTEGFVAACEQGNFEHIHNHARRPGSVSAARKEV
ncbi:MAG: phage regulatory CII family protein [Verrucomicrobiia bacterium]